MSEHFHDEIDKLVDEFHRKAQRRIDAVFNPIIYGSLVVAIICFGALVTIELLK